MNELNEQMIDAEAFRALSKISTEWKLSFVSGNCYEIDIEHCESEGISLHQNTDVMKNKKLALRKLIHDAQNELNGKH